MEQVKISDLEEYWEDCPVKKVAVMTDDLIGTVYYLNADHENLTVEDSHNDRIYIVIRGSGAITIDGGTSLITEGGMVLVIRYKKGQYLQQDR